MLMLVRAITFPPHNRAIGPITMHWVTGQSEHPVLFRARSFVKIGFKKAGQREATVMYGKK